MSDINQIRKGFFNPTPVLKQEKVNGLENFVRSKLKTIKRLQYAIIYVVCTSVLLFQIGQCAFKYLDKNTGTADTYVHVSNTTFPVLTICPTYPYKLDVIQQNGIETLSDVQWQANWNSNNSEKSPKDFYNEMVLQIDDIVANTKFYIEQPINGSNILDLKPYETVCNGQDIFIVKPYYFNGNCYAMKVPDCLEKSGVLEVVFDFYDKTDIFIHHPGQFLSPNSRSRVDVQLGSFTKIAINHEVVQLIGGEDFSTCVANYGEYSDFDDCMYQTMQKLMLEQVGCTVPWIPDKSKICRDKQKRNAAFEIYQQNRRNQKDICPRSCLFTNMYFGPPVIGKNNKEKLKFAWGIFYFRRDIKTTNEYLLYSLLSMAAEIGGYVGLLLGASLVNIGHINNFLLDNFFGQTNTDINNNEVKDISKQNLKIGPSYTTTGRRATLASKFYNDNSHYFTS
jgi:hypothetical protein